MSNVVSKEGALQSLKLYRLQRCFNLCDEVLDVAITALSEIQQYRAIGTVEELRELKEKATAKMPVKTVEFIEGGWIGKCPTCGTDCNDAMNYCDQCGTAFDWSEGKE